MCIRDSLHPAAQHPALKSGNDWLADITHDRSILYPITERPDIRYVSKRVEIASGRKRAIPRSRDRGHTNLVIVVDLPADTAKLQCHIPRDRVVFLRPRENDLYDAVAHRQFNTACHHASFSSFV